MQLDSSAYELVWLYINLYENLPFALKYLIVFVVSAAAVFALVFPFLYFRAYAPQQPPFAYLYSDDQITSSELSDDIERQKALRGSLLIFFILFLWPALFPLSLSLNMALSSSESSALDHLGDLAIMLSITLLFTTIMPIMAFHVILNFLFKWRLRKRYKLSRDATDELLKTAGLQSS